MPARQARRRRKSRKLSATTALPPVVPQRCVQTWRAVSGDGILCELYAAADDSEACSIMHESTRAVEIDDLPCKWPADASACDTAQLPCGHVFHPAALALHFLVSDMRCPVCRAGLAELMHIESVPAEIRPAFVEKTQRVVAAAQRPADIAQLREDIMHVLCNIEVMFSVLGSGQHRASARTRLVFEAQQLHAIEQQVLHAWDSAQHVQQAHEMPHLSAASSSEFDMHRSFQRLVRGVVARQHQNDASRQVRFSLLHPLVPVTIESMDISVTEAWSCFFNTTPESQLGECGTAQPDPIPLYCAAIAGTAPVGFIKARFDDNAPAPRLTAQLNTLMLVNIAAYVREVLESIREAVELHTSFDAEVSPEITAQAINGVVFAS